MITTHNKVGYVLAIRDAHRWQLVRLGQSVAVLALVFIAELDKIFLAAAAFNIHTNIIINER